MEVGLLNEQNHGLIPSRLGSKVTGKALAKIEEMPVIVHVAKRAKLSTLLNQVVVCTDNQEIANIVRNMILKLN